MLHLLRSNQQDNTKSHNKIKKAFTIVEIIIGISIGTCLILTTYVSLSQSMVTMNNVSVAGTVDNYAFRIQREIRRELISARDIDVAKTNADKIIIKDGSGNITDSYLPNLYYTNNDYYNYGIIYDKASQSIDVIYYPDEKTNRKTKNLFSEVNSNQVKLTDFRFFTDSYATSETYYNTPDYNPDSTKLIKYQFTLRKNLGEGKYVEKTYFAKEVIECSN